MSTPGLMRAAWVPPPHVLLQAQLTGGREAHVTGEDAKVSSGQRLPAASPRENAHLYFLSRNDNMITGASGQSGQGQVSSGNNTKLSCHLDSALLILSTSERYS